MPLPSFLVAPLGTGMLLNPFIREEVKILLRNFMFLRNKKIDTVKKRLKYGPFFWETGQSLGLSPACPYFNLGSNSAGFRQNNALLVVLNALKDWNTKISNFAFFSKVVFSHQYCASRILKMTEVSFWLKEWGVYNFLWFFQRSPVWLWEKLQLIFCGFLSCNWENTCIPLLQTVDILKHLTTLHKCQ